MFPTTTYTYVYIQLYHKDHICAARLTISAACDTTNNMQPHAVLIVFSHTILKDVNVDDLSVGPPLWFRLKCLPNACHKIVYRHSL